jgi:hypothetical protein
MSNAFFYATEHHFWRQVWLGLRCAREINSTTGKYLNPGRNSCAALCAGVPTRIY